MWSGRGWTSLRTPSRGRRRGTPGDWALLGVGVGLLALLAFALPPRPSLNPFGAPREAVVEVKRVVGGRGADEQPATFGYLVVLPDGTEREVWLGAVYAPGSRLKLLYAERRGHRRVRALAVARCQEDCARPASGTN